jgi:hypothetical protein
MKQETDTNFRQVLGRLVVTSFSEFQGQRIALMSMMRDVIRRKDLGLAFDETEKKVEKEDKKYEKDYADEFLKPKIALMRKEGKLTEQEEKYISEVMEAIERVKEQENEFRKLLPQYIEQEPIWTEFLQHIKGVSFVLASNLLMLFGYCDGKKEDGTDICPTISSLWQYSGIGSPDQKKKKGVKISYNPKAKVLLWKIADSFIKQNTPIYRDIYDTEKEKQFQILSQNKEEKAVKMHSHLRAMRKMAKIFESHYWLCAREMKGLPVSQPYIAGKGNHTHIITWRQVVEANKILIKTKRVKAIKKALKVKEPLKE